MKDFEIYVVDAFTDRAFSGNPAAVVLVTSDCDDRWMQSLASEMRHSETAFVDVRDESKPLPLRWFTPNTEVALCGHATLATAHVLGGSRTFDTMSGELRCMSTDDGRIQLDFPADPVTPIVAVDETSRDATKGLSVTDVGRTASDRIVVVSSAEDLRSHSPDIGAIASLQARGLIVTALGDREGIDIVSRYFAPAIGIDEDPVTGAAHCVLASYWSQRLGKLELVGEQASARGGIVHMRIDGDRVFLSGSAVTVLSGRLAC